MEQGLIKFRHNVINVNSLSVFINLKGGINGNCKDVSFVRALGVNRNLPEDIVQMDDTLSEYMVHGRLGYKRLVQLPALSSPQEAERYASSYASWLSSGKRRMETRFLPGNEILKQTLGNACRIILECYRKGKQVSETMEKNLLVKLLYWFDNVMEDFLKEWNEQSCIKIVAENVQREQEYLFFYMLTLAGADVLLIQTKADVSARPELLKLSQELFLGPYGTCMIPAPKLHSQREERTSRSSPTKVRIPVKAQTQQRSGGIIQEQHSEKGMVKVQLPRRESRKGTPRSPQSTVPMAPLQESMTQGGEKSFEELARLASSVVMIAVHDKSKAVTATGSGIMIGTNGYILTNHHVVAGGCYYSVRIEDDEAIYDTDEIIKYHNVLDLAILRIDRRLQPIPVYKGKQKLVRGQKVVAIGSPLGLFNSVSDGIISGFRKIDGVDMIQFTAPTSHGSSGGAVLNMQGQVIGISTAGIDSGQNLNLAMGYECIGDFVRGFV